VSQAGGRVESLAVNIRISKESEVSLRQQLAEQIVFLIATEKLRPGEALPSVRGLARRLKIHHNTVSEAYQDLVRRTWLVRRRGTRVIVRAYGPAAASRRAPDLDDLINTTIRVAREQGYSLQALRERVRARLLAEPPDHILVVEEEPGLRELLAEEIRQALPWPVAGCSREEFAAAPGLGVGALPVAGQYAIPDVDPLASKDRPAVTLAFSAADEHLEQIRRLDKPSVVGVFSVSEAFLKTARSLLAPALGRRHTLCEFRSPRARNQSFSGVDLLFCDTVALRRVKHPRLVHYRLIDPKSLDYLGSAMKSYQSR